MWTTETRARHDRDMLRYPSDLTDDEWALAAPLTPLAKRSGRKHESNEQELVNGIMHVLSTGCQFMTPLIFDWRITATDLAMTLNGAACCLRLSALFRPQASRMAWPPGRVEPVA